MLLNCSHWTFYVSHKHTLSLSVPGSLFRSLSLYLCLSLSVFVSICLFLCLSLSVSLSVSLSLYLSVCLYMSLCLALSLCLSLCVSLSLSLSAFPPPLSVHTGRHWGVNVPAGAVDCGLLLNKPSCSNHQSSPLFIMRAGGFIRSSPLALASFASKQLQKCWQCDDLVFMICLIFVCFFGPSQSN